MQFHRARYGLIMLLALGLLAQGPNKPNLTSVHIIPSEPPVERAQCTSSRSGYLQMIGDGRAQLTDTEVGRHVLARLREGYIVTLYPPSKSGIFVDADCPASQQTISKAP
jgi:hypothetical protein